MFLIICIRRTIIFIRDRDERRDKEREIFARELARINANDFKGEN